MNFYKAISLGFYILAWLQRASQDGKITQDEIVEMIGGAIAAVDLKVEIDLPDTMSTKSRIA